jgi:hypothetical protein
MDLNELFCQDFKQGITDVKRNLTTNSRLQKPTLTKGGGPKRAK